MAFLALHELGRGLVKEHASARALLGCGPATAPRRVWHVHETGTRCGPLNRQTSLSPRAALTQLFENRSVRSGVPGFVPGEAWLQARCFVARADFGDVHGRSTIRARWLEQRRPTPPCPYVPISGAVAGPR